MKSFAFLVISHFISLFAVGKDGSYTASTAANAIVREFLGISSADSVDFIRWKINISGSTYQLQCNYGVGKNNTNSFINGGKKIELNGSLTKQDHYYRFQNGNHLLFLAELNEDLLHITDDNHNLLPGNGGWSYTLNNVSPISSTNLNLTRSATPITDSIVYQGRTPCKIPGIVAPETECYKLKWKIILYVDKLTHEPAGYKIAGTLFRIEGGRKGDWKILNNKKGRIAYQLNDENGKGFINLLMLDDNILLFTDSEGKLLTGDEDFSYTLNKAYH